MAEVDREEDLAGDRVARVRADLDKADRRAGEGRMSVADTVDRVDHAGGTDQRIASPRHRCRPGMRLLAGGVDVVPALALGAGDDADRQACRLENRPLLDMRLEIGLDWPAADRLGAGKADALELGTECDAGNVVRPRQRL